MTAEKKLFKKILSGSKNIHFKDFVRLVESFGFSLSRIKGSHHVFCHPHVEELINIQEVNGKAKPYQIRQFLKLVEKYNLQVQ